MSTIFPGRDGVINEHRADYVKSWSEFRFLPGSCEAIAKLTQAGHRIVVCTNQAGIARGIVSVDTVHEIHCRMLAAIGEVGGKIEKVYFCPHGKEENCACRKPRPGMLLRARDELGQDHMSILFLLDILAWDKYVGIDEIFDQPTFGAEQADSGGARLFCQAHGIDDVGRVAAGADADHHVSRLDHVCQFGEVGGDRF